MELSLDFSQGKYQIRSYEPGRLVINTETYTQSIIVSLNDLSLWPPNSFAELQPNHLEAILVLQPQIVLLGTGEKQIFPPPELLAVFADKNIGVEVMNTAAACRTFNVLVSEGRNVAAGLLIK